MSIEPDPDRSLDIDGADRSAMAAKRLTLTVPEAAEILGIGRATAYECVRTGEIPSIRLAGRILIPTRLLDELLEGTKHA